MYTLGREDQLSWDSEESFPPKKLITTHFSTDSCSFPLKEIPSNTIHNIDKPNYSQKIDSFYFKTSTIFQDQTRASSPITNRVSPSPLVPHKSSSFDSFDEDCISNYNRKIETLKSQLDQLYLVRDRHSGIKAYINSIKEQLQNSFNLGIVELQRQRKAYVDKIDEQYDLAFNQMCLGHKEKELKIKIRDQELECVICQIKNTISMIELKLRAEPKQRLLDNFEKIYKESEATLKIWAPECDLTPQWTNLMPPQFDLQIINRNGELAKESRVNISNTESSKDNLSIRTENSILELLDRDKILKEIVKIQEKSESHRCSSRTRNKSSERCKRGKKLSVLAKQNSDIAERLGKIEKSIERNVYVSRKPSLDALTEASLRSTSENFWNLEDIDNPISISTLFSENSDPKQFPYNTSRIKVYIPQGYPAYSSYYYVKYHSEAQIEEILASLCETMQIDKKGCVLKVKEIDGKNRNLDLKEKAKDLHKVSNGSLPKVYLQQIKKEI